MLWPKPSYKPKKSDRLTQATSSAASQYAFSSLFLAPSATDSNRNIQLTVVSKTSVPCIAPSATLGGAGLLSGGVGCKEESSAKAEQK